ncbi:ABC transporter permease [Arthrobacter sp. MYb229]|uniref:ABC transporter permease n=1 Tax=unclassified Arthrobacter TaxID=235627 RepID=UPI000CFD5AF5|nr:MULTISPECIES: ABC transporter permease [unclassified Arthrobacter]PRA02473.1 ABC transporter permease [Arthrobacter sp. MYb229]PRB50584.1 ABC transporter permease [Arthrobacter sp. MYb216]
MSTSTTLINAPRKRTMGYGAAFNTCLGFLVLVILGAVLAPWIAPYAPDEIDFSAIWTSPGAGHLFGTDQLGRDIFSRVLFGARESLIGPLLLLALATVLGVLIGTLAAWHGGWVDTLLARITDVMFAFPGLLFVVLVIAVFGKGPATAILALALAYAPVIAKFTRSIALAELSRPYIDAYRIQGVSAPMICLRYLIPNMSPALLGYLVVLFGEGLMSLATLSFLGFGAQPPSSEWGLMVQEGQAGIIQGHLWPTLAPGLVIAAVVVAVNIVGVRLSDQLNVKKP